MLRLPDAKASKAAQQAEASPETDADASKPDTVEPAAESIDPKKAAVAAAVARAKARKAAQQAGSNTGNGC
ncbi:electron transporter RnfC [Enterovibrio sp. Hal110]